MDLRSRHHLFFPRFYLSQSLGRPSGCSSLRICVWTYKQQDRVQESWKSSFFSLRFPAWKFSLFVYIYSTVHTTVYVYSHCLKLAGACLGDIVRILVPTRSCEGFHLKHISLSIMELCFLSFFHCRVISFSILT